MRVIDRHRVAKFIDTVATADQADTLRAWISEFEHRTWKDAASLIGEYANAVSKDATIISFTVANGGIRIETTNDFRNSVSIITAVKATKSSQKTKLNSACEEAA